MRILERGYHVAYEPAAVAFEEALEMEGFSRRVRIARASSNCAKSEPALATAAVCLFCLLSHKTGRLLVPVFMLIARQRISLCAANFLQLVTG
jgi:hypothetical protein